MEKGVEVVGKRVVGGGCLPWRVEGQVKIIGDRFENRELTM